MTYSSTVLSNTPVHYWRLGESSGNAADSAGTLALTPHGTLARAALGGLAADSDRACGFDGSTGYLNATAPTGLVAGGGARTVEAWIQLPAGSSGGTIFSYGLSGQQGWHVQAATVGGVTYLFSDGVNIGNNVTGSLPSLLYWHHFAFTYDGAGNWAYYLDGSLISSGTFSVAINTVVSTTELDSGRRSDGNGQFFNGNIDELAFYNYALSAAQVAAHYTAGRTAPLPTGAYAGAVMADTPFAYYRMGDQSAICADSSGNNRHGGYLGGFTVGTTGLLTGDSDKAATFDGSTGYVDCGTQNLTLNACTVEAWIKPSAYNTSVASFDGSTGISQIAGIETVNDVQACFLRLGLDGTLAAEAVMLFANVTGVGTGTTGRAANANSTMRHPWTVGVVGFGTTLAQLNVRHHLVGVYDGSSVSFYLDGRFIGSAAAPQAAPQQANGPFWIADNYGVPNRNFAGVLDEVAVYDHALSATRIAAHYAAGA